MGGADPVEVEVSLKADTRHQSPRPHYTMVGEMRLETRLSFWILLWVAKALEYGTVRHDWVLVVAKAHGRETIWYVDAHLSQPPERRLLAAPLLLGSEPWNHPLHERSDCPAVRTSISDSIGTATPSPILGRVSKDRSPVRTSPASSKPIQCVHIPLGISVAIIPYLPSHKSPDAWDNDSSRPSSHTGQDRRPRTYSSSRWARSVHPKLARWKKAGRALPMPSHAAPLQLTFQVRVKRGFSPSQRNDLAVVGIESCRRAKKGCRCRVITVALKRGRTSYSQQ